MSPEWFLALSQDPGEGAGYQSVPGRHDSMGYSGQARSVEPGTSPRTGGLWNKQIAWMSSNTFLVRVQREKSSGGQARDKEDKGNLGESALEGQWQEVPLFPVHTFDLNVPHWICLTMGQGSSSRFHSNRDGGAGVFHWRIWIWNT